MRVDDRTEIVHGESVADRDTDLVDDLDSVDAHDGRAEETIGGCVGVELGKPVGLALAERLAVAQIARLAKLDVDARRFRGLRVHADHGDFRMRVDAGRHHGSIHRHDIVAERVFDRATALGAAEVRELETADAVARRPDLGVRGSQERVDDNVVAVVDDHAGVLEPDAAGLGAPADGDEQEVGLDAL